MIISTGIKRANNNATVSLLFSDETLTGSKGHVVVSSVWLEWRPSFSLGWKYITLALSSFSFRNSDHEQEFQVKMKLV